MGVVLNQIDSSSNIVTCVVVDKYGEVVIHSSFSKLLMPRSVALKIEHSGQPGKHYDDSDVRQKKLKIQQEEEEKEYNKDCDRLKELIKEFDIELIVVGANSLEARRLMQAIDDIAQNMHTLNTKDKKDGQPN